MAYNAHRVIVYSALYELTSGSGYFLPFKYIASAVPLSQLLSILDIPYSPVTYPHK